MRRRALIRTIFAALLTTCVLAGLATPAEAAPTTKEKRLITAINNARAAHGVRRLRIGPRIQAGAHAWARTLIRTDSFRHGRLAAGVSENIAWGTCNWMTPAKAVRLWLRSPGHRRILLDRSARYVGAGWAAGAWRRYRCVEMAVARFR
jgi:uncharacterized protein YkwD